MFLTLILIQYVIKENTMAIFQLVIFKYFDCRTAAVVHYIRLAKNR